MGVRDGDVFNSFSSMGGLTCMIVRRFQVHSTTTMISTPREKTACILELSLSPQMYMIPGACAWGRTKSGSDKTPVEP